MHRKPFVKDPSKPLKRDLLLSIHHWFRKKTSLLLQKKISPKQIILDPGIGFGTTFVENMEILLHIDFFTSLGLPILIGASRKRFLRFLLNNSDENLLYATLLVGKIAAEKGASILRVHDVKEHKKILSIPPIDSKKVLCQS